MNIVYWGTKLTRNHLKDITENIYNVDNKKEFKEVLKQFHKIGTNITVKGVNYEAFLVNRAIITIGVRPIGKHIDGYMLLAILNA